MAKQTNIPGEPLTEKLYAKVDEVFRIFDEKGTQEIDIPEALDHWKDSPGGFAKISAQEMFATVDANGDDKILLDEWRHFWEVVKKSGYSEQNITEELDNITNADAWCGFENLPAPFNVTSHTRPAEVRPVEHLTDDVRAKVDEVFRIFDEDESGEIDTNEALSHWKGGFGKISAKEMFATVDDNGDGKILLDEWRHFWEVVKRSGYSDETITEELENIKNAESWCGFDNLPHPYNSVTRAVSSSSLLKAPKIPDELLAKVDEVFRVFDKDGSGEIDTEEALSHWKGGFGKISAREMFKTVDDNADGKILLSEWRHFWTIVSKSGYSDETIAEELENIQNSMSWCGFKNLPAPYNLSLTRTQSHGFAPQNKLSDDLYAKVDEVFHVFDEDGSGEIDTEEALGHWPGKFGKLSARAMFSTVDDDGDGRILLKEWRHFWEIVKKSGYTEETIAEELENIKNAESWCGFENLPYPYNATSQRE